MKRTLSTCFILLWILCPIVIWAQNSKRKVASAAELPHFSYDVPDNLTDLLTDEAAYKVLATKVRSDLEGVLRDYEIEDKTTLKNIQATLAELDLQDGKPDTALERMRLALLLEEKPESKYLPNFFDTQTVAKAQQRSGAVSGEKFLEALGTVLAETLNAIPESVFAGVKEYRFGYDLYNANFAAGIVKARLTPIANKNGGKLFSEDAYMLIALKTLHKFIVPVAGEFARSFDDYIAARKNAPKVNIWPNRSVSLNGNKKLSPVVVAVWDSGVDAKIFPHQMFVNRREKLDGKDNDHNNFIDDVNGLSFDLNGKYTTEPLFVLEDEDAKKYAGWVKQRRVLAKLQDAIDDEETRALKQKFQSQTPAEVAEELRVDNIFAKNYTHGTEVASIVAEGNPAVRILNGRRTWVDQSGQNDSLTENAEYAWNFAARIKIYVDYFKKQNARLVNMSWSLSRRGIEENLEKNAPHMTATERKSEADKSFTIIKNALLTAFRSAPEILFVASAGNTNSDAGFNEAIPSSLELPNLITVGAVDERGVAASFTSFGKNILLYAQGVNVRAQIPGGEILMFGGTSAAAPGVSNLAAKLIAIDPKLKVAEVVKFIQDGVDTSEADKRLKLVNPKRSLELLVSRKRN